MKKIVILGSTGSIGKSTLSVIQNNPSDYQIFALVGGKNVELMAAQCVLFQPQFVALDDENAATQLKVYLSTLNIKTQVLAGQKAICELASHPEVDMVMAAIVGAAGLLPTLSAVKAGKRVSLAGRFLLMKRESQVQNSCLLIANIMRFSNLCLRKHKIRSVFARLQSLV